MRRMTAISRTLLPILLLTQWASPAHGQATQFQGLGGGNTTAIPLAVSGDGTVVTGTNVNNTVGFHWTAGGGTVSLGDFLPRDVSVDGGVIAGLRRLPLGGSEPVRWTQAGGAVSLSAVGGLALGVSADGSAVVGITDVPFVWTGAIVPSPVPPAGVGACINTGVSADGTVVVGGCSALPGFFYRSVNGVATRIFGVDTYRSSSGGDGASESSSISADGNVIIGTIFKGFTAGIGNQYSGGVWLVNGTVLEVQPLPGDHSTYVNGVSGAGRCVAGYSDEQNGIAVVDRQALIWDPVAGSRRLQDVLVNDFNLGAALTGWTLVKALDVDDDCSTIVGWGVAPGGGVDGFIVTNFVPPAVTAITLTDSLGDDDDNNLPFGEVAVGAQEVATVTVDNSSGGAVGVSIAVDLDPATTPFDIADPDDCTLTLPNGQSCTITIAYRPIAIGTLSARFTLSIAGQNVDIDVSGTGRLPIVSVTDSIAEFNDSALLFGNTVAVGTSGSGTVTFTNTDLATVDLQLTDDLAAPFSIQNPATCDGVTLAPNQNCVLTVVFSPGAVGTFADRFTVDAGGTTLPVDVSGTPGLPNADLQVTKTADNLILQPGVSGSDLATFTITAQNNGPDAADATVVDLLPAGLAIVGAAAAGQGSYDPVTGTWAVGTLATGAQTTLQIQARAEAAAAGCIINAATISPVAPALDPRSANNSASLAIGAPACADLELTPTAVTDDISINPDVNNYRVTHYIHVINRGPGPATGVVLNVTRYQGNLNLHSQTVLPPGLRTITIGNLGVGQMSKVLIADYEVGRPSADIGVSVAVNVDGAEPDPDSTNDAGAGSYVIGGTHESSHCFIATAAYGSYLEPQVIVLRHFRDQYLLTNGPGRAFVAWYYRASPPVAEFIRHRGWLRAMARAALTPVVYAVRYPAGMGLLVLVAPLWLIGKQASRVSTRA